MDLEIDEVSELLNVPMAVLCEWITEGKIPAYSIHDRYRFNRQEIENWILKQNDAQTRNERTGLKKGHQHFNLYRAIHKGDVIHDSKSHDRASAFTSAAEKIAHKLQLDSEIVLEHLLERENLAPTALGYGYAIPHARDFLLTGQHDSVTVVFLQNPIAYGALDNQPVHTLFFLFACDDKRHLALLSKIAHLLQKLPIREFLASQPEKKALLDLIKNWETTLH